VKVKVPGLLPGFRTPPALIRTPVVAPEIVPDPPKVAPPLTTTLLP
jgi:hypothetical protein